ncbi:MAG: DUF1684 domain-containing protein [Candidatus Latescibacterota bacterium]
MRTAPSLLTTLVSVLALCRCLAAQPSPGELAAQIAQGRAAKDSLLRHAADSPIPEPQRPRFAGLRYFAIDLRYRVPCELHRYGRPRQVEVPTTDGRSMPMERLGLLRGHLGSVSFSLLVYRSLEDNALLVPFTDPTNGRQTYGGGRYVHVQVEEDGRHVLDFNTAYNPYCAYNADYICPVPPPQNRLPVPVPAGEMAYGGSDVAH